MAGLRGASESVFLAGWPEARDRLRDRALLEEVAVGRQVTELARSARQQAGIKLRHRSAGSSSPRATPAAALVSRQVEELAGELRVKEVAISASPNEVAELRAMPRLDLVGARYGPNLPPSCGDSSPKGASRSRTAHCGRARSCSAKVSSRSTTRRAKAGPSSTATSTSSASTLGWTRSSGSGRVYDLIHAVQGLRREAGLEISDRIVLTLAEARDLLPEYEDWTKGESPASGQHQARSSAVARSRKTPSWSGPRPDRGRG